MNFCGLKTLKKCVILYLSLLKEKINMGQLNPDKIYANVGEVNSEFDYEDFVCFMTQICPKVSAILSM